MKTCKQLTCTYPIWSHEFCKNHQHLRIDSSYLKKQALAKEKRFHPVKKATRNLTFGFKGELDMFNHIWEERSHICEFTGEDLERFYGTDLWFSCFLHVLPKGRFPLFKLNSMNVRLGFPLFHQVVDSGTEEDRLLYPQWNFKKWDKLTQEMKEEYLQFKRDNLLS